MNPVRKLDQRIAQLEKVLRDSMAETGPLHSTPVSRTQDQADSVVGTTQNPANMHMINSHIFYKHH
jgi:hypothetical protein